MLCLGRAPRTKETLPDFLKWRRVNRHPLVFRRLTGSQRTPGIGASQVLSWGWLPRWWWLRLIMTFRGYVAAKIPPSNQVFYFLPELYAIFRSMPVVPIELSIWCYLFWLGPTSSGMAISENFHVIPCARPVILWLSGG